MKIIENPPNDDLTLPKCWQLFRGDFAAAICKTLGVDGNRVTKIEIIIEANVERPRVLVTLEPQIQEELQPILEVFTAAEWKPENRKG